MFGAAADVTDTRAVALRACMPDQTIFVAAVAGLLNLTCAPARDAGAVTANAVALGAGNRLLAAAAALGAVCLTVAAAEHTHGWSLWCAHFTHSGALLAAHGLAAGYQCVATFGLMGAA